MGICTIYIYTHMYLLYMGLVFKGITGFRGSYNTS